MRPENIVTADAMRAHLKGLRNIPRILKMLKVGKAGLNEWQGVVKVDILRSYFGSAFKLMTSVYVSCVAA